MPIIKHSALSVAFLLISTGASADPICRSDDPAFDACAYAESVEIAFRHQTPIILTEAITLAEVSAAGSTITANYIIERDSEDNLPKDDFVIRSWEERRKNELCSNGPTSGFLRLGGHLILRYSLSSGLLWNESRIDEGTCNSLLGLSVVNVETEPPANLQPQKPAPNLGKGWVSGPNPTYDNYRLTIIPGTEAPPTIINGMEMRGVITKPSAAQIWGAAFRLENVFGSTLAREQMPPAEWTPDFDALSDENLKGYEDFSGRFIDIRSPEQSEVMKRQIDRELADKKTLENAGIQGNLAIGAAILLDWRGILGLGGLLLIWAISRRSIRNS